MAQADLSPCPVTRAAVTPGESSVERGDGERIGKGKKKKEENKKEKK